MKEAPDFDFIESQAQDFKQALFCNDLFQEQKKQFCADQLIDREQQQDSILRTPKSKRGRKFSLKNNPEEGSGSKLKMKEKKYKNMVGDKQKNPNQLFGHWSVQQNKRYHWFLQIFHCHFMNRSLRRMDRIFTSMAKFVGTREAQQCRSHHQKMQKKHKTFTKILLSLRMNHYGNQSPKALKEDIQKNQIEIIEALLTQQFLIQNLSTKQSIIQLQEQKEQRKSDDIEKQYEDEGKEKEPGVQCEVQNIESVLVPEYESSKNYFKFVLPNQDRNNILDDGYESHLPFNGFYL